MCKIQKPVKEINMKRIYMLLAIIVVVIASFPYVNHAQNKEGPFFSNGDRICFLGNSITHSGQYHEFIQLFYATRYPNTKLTFRNCGIAGDVADGMLSRLEYDVLKHEPTHVFLMVGMNDIGRSLYFEGEADKDILIKRQEALDNYFIKTDSLTKELVKNKVMPIFLIPSIYDQYSKIERANFVGANDALLLCGQHLKGLAKKYNAPVIDLNSIMREITLQELKRDSLFTMCGDRVHPGSLGHFIMAYQILASLEKHSFVSKIEIDLSDKSKSSFENCKVSQLSLTRDGIRFECGEFALPYSFTKATADALKYVPFEETLNQQTLKVSNLEKGDYNLIIADELIGSYSARQLCEGIDIANNYKTPQYKQAEKVRELCAEYGKTNKRLRSVAFVKCGYLEEYKGDDSVKEKKEYLKKVTPQKGERYHDYIQEKVAQYFKILPQVNSLESRLVQITNRIYTLNKPIEMKWQVVRKKN